MSSSTMGRHADRVHRLVGSGLVTPAADHPAAGHLDAGHVAAGHASADHPAGGQYVTPAVDGSWRRCVNDFKLDPLRDYETKVLDHTLLKCLQSEHEELVQIARAEMDSLYEQIAGSGYALLLADTAGVILCEKIDPVLKRMFEGAGLIVGAEWSEQREGTNGIGTCAAEARPITIHQSDHFRSRHVALSCSAAPIHDQHGRVIGVLDASCINGESSRESQMHTVALVNTSARLIEKCLFLRRHQTGALLRFHHRPEFVDLLHDGAMAVDRDGIIVATDMTGFRLLGARDRSELVGRSIAEVFDASFDELSAACTTGRRAVWELRDNLRGRRYYASMVPADQHGKRASKPLPDPARAIVHVARRSAPPVLSLTDLAGDDPKMMRNLRIAQRVADHSVSVIIRGPTGSGKEVFARALHQFSVRGTHAFVAINCGAIPETLIESELFGYAPGAFTGARKDGMRGRIAQSSGGTLFLDEIGDMPLLLQTRLLRALEEQEVTPLGGAAPLKVDLRVICASHRDLRVLVDRGEFREDLYYRLNGITLNLPPLSLRQDRENVIRQCIARESGGSAAAAIEMAALQRLLDYSWPGNIRELRNTIRTALALCDDRVIRCRDLPDEIVGGTPLLSAQPAPDTARLEAVDYGANGQAASGARTSAPGVGGAAADSQVSFAGAERAALLTVIEHQQWVMSRVAAHFGISRNTLYRKIKRHGISLVRPIDVRCPV